MSKRECTDGDFPCEMSTHLAALEAENLKLKSLIADIKQWDISTAREIFMKTGKAMQLTIPQELRSRIHKILG